MTEHNFFLLPFASSGILARIEITGEAARLSNSLTIRYVVTGVLGEVAISDFSDRPVRKSGLWEQTCFEFFLAEKNSKSYWEFNLSPSGDWNVYRFEAYRQGMEEETAFTSLPLKVRRKEDSLMLELQVDLDRTVRVDQILQVGICAVIQQKDGAKTYWALTHCGLQADFHRRDSFIIHL